MLVYQRVVMLYIGTSDIEWKPEEPDGTGQFYMSRKNNFPEDVPVPD